MRGLVAAPDRIPDLDALTAQEVLAHASEEFAPRLYVASSFQKEASVVMDMLLKIDPDAITPATTLSAIREKARRSRLT